MQDVVGVDLLIEGFGFHVGRNALDSIQIPAKDSAERSQTERLDALRDGQIVPPSHLPLVFILVPWIQRQSHHLMIDLREARILKVSDGVARVVGYGAHGVLCSLLQKLVPLAQSQAVQRAVIASGFKVDFHLLEPGTRS